MPKVVRKVRSFWLHRSRANCRKKEEKPITVGPPALNN
jgi:hypothetical protein